MLEQLWNVANLLIFVEESNDSWQLARMRGHSMYCKTTRLLLFTGANFVTLEALRTNTESPSSLKHIWMGHWQSHIYWTTAQSCQIFPACTLSLTTLPGKHNKKSIFDKYSRKQTNAVPLFVHDTNKSRVWPYSMVLVLYCMRIYVMVLLTIVFQNWSKCYMKLKPPLWYIISVITLIYILNLWHSIKPFIKQRNKLPGVSGTMYKYCMCS